jgi:hypothetical protein
MCPIVLDAVSLLRRAPVLPCVPHLQSHFPTEEGSNATMCPAALDPPPCCGGLRRCHVSCSSRPAFLLGRTLVLPRVSRLSEGREPQI